MEYKFADGNNNIYKIKDSYLSYSPISRKESSSGIYDGGQPFHRELSKIDMMRFVDAIERAIWNSADHSENREMGSGMITKTLGDEVQRVILKRNSESMEEIEELFRSYRN